MNVLKINGKVYDVLITGLSRSFAINQSENSGKTLSNGARIVLDPLGTEIGYIVTVHRKRGYEKEYDNLWDFVIQPRYNGVPVEVVYNQTTISFDAYFTTGSQSLKKFDDKTNKVYWDSFDIEIMPMEAQVKPNE